MNTKLVDIINSLLYKRTDKRENKKALYIIVHIRLNKK